MKGEAWEEGAVRFPKRTLERLVSDQQATLCFVEGASPGENAAFSMVAATFGAFAGVLSATDKVLAVSGKVLFSMDKVLAVSGKVLFSMDKVLSGLGKVLPTMAIALSAI